MLISLRKDHREHLHYLTIQPVKVLEDFCTLAIEFFEKGPDVEKYVKIAKRLGVDVNVVQNSVHGIAQLLLLGCKHKLSDADFRDSVLTVGFPQDQQAVLSNLYDTKQSEIQEVLKIPINEPHYDDLRWRFEAQVSSRSLLNQIVPIVTLELSTKTDLNGVFEREKCLLQTDPNNLLHIVNELENAWTESKSRHSKKIQRALKS